MSHRKLSPEAVAHIRRGEMPNVAYAELYGVRLRTVWDILHGRAYVTKEKCGGKRRPLGMSNAEINKIIRARYPVGGYQACLPELRFLTRQAVKSRANRMGVSMPLDVQKRHMSMGARSTVKIRRACDWHALEDRAMARVSWQNSWINRMKPGSNASPWKP